MRKCLLNGYISDRVQYTQVNSQSYKIVTYQQEHKDEYTIYAMQNNKEHGLAQHFERGVIRYSWEMKEGKRCNDVTSYERGKAKYKILWNGLENGECRMLENCIAGLRMTIRDESGAICFYGICDQSLRKNGHGIVYDVETGRPLFCGLFADDVQTHVYQDFHDNTMTEYRIDEDSNLPLLKRIPVYVGEYLFTEKDLYVRHGKGSLIDPVTGFASKECVWENGEMVESVDLHSGWYWYPGETTSLRGSVLCPRPASSQLHTSTVTKTITTLVIPDNYDNASIHCLNFGEYAKLTTLTVGDDSLCHVTQVVIMAMEMLRSVKIGHRSFSSKTALERLRDVDVVEGTELCIEDCPCLKKLRIGALSFVEYESLRLNHLPSLNEIRIGETDRSKCFFHCRELHVQCSRWEE